MHPWIGRAGNLGPFATDGQRYFTLASGGVKEEVGPVPEICSSRDKAWESYNIALAEMVKTHPGCTIVWRVEPTLQPSFERRGGRPPLTRYWVRSRLAFVKAAA